MMRTFGAAALLALATVMPVQEAKAQDALGGAILGGAAGAILGGAITGRGSGAAAGALVGAATGAILPTRRSAAATAATGGAAAATSRTVRQLVPRSSASLLTAQKVPDLRGHVAAVLAARETACHLRRCQLSARAGIRPALLRVRWPCPRGRCDSRRRIGAADQRPRSLVRDLP